MSVARKEHGSTRQSILQLLRRHGQLTALELSDYLAIGAVGIRQHLALLERDELVQVVALRRNVGRPSHLYALTTAAEKLFPKRYDQFALEMLDHMANTAGTNTVVNLLSLQRQNLASSLAPRFANKTRAEQVAELAEVLVERGYMPEVEQLDDGSFQLTEFNCPIDCVARCYPHVCAEELRLYEDLLGVPIKRDTTLVEGGLGCRYAIPA
ncbi:MAG: HTH domain-containing protein [Chloroflexaceae bacterium]|jgi:predicted ArsR family transcriptional regulator|nr:HTH domain-containing protein [Chloroflexaceae bacterium]